MLIQTKGRNFIGGGKRPISVEYLGRYDITTSNTTFTFGSVSVPRAGLLVLAMGAVKGSPVSARQFSSFTVDGNAGVVDVTSNNSVTSAIGHYEMLAAGTVSIAVTMSAACIECSIDVYLVEGYTNTAPYSSNQNAGTSGTTSAISLNYPDNSIGIFHGNCGVGSGISWSSATEDNDALVSAYPYACAHLEKSVAATSVTETITHSNGYRALAGAVFY